MELDTPRHARSTITPVRLTCGPSMTKQSFKDECDINKILARYQQTGVLDFANKYEPQYADVTSIDFTTAMNQVALAQSMFDDLPSSLRARFRNDPSLFIEFIDNPANHQEMRELGLLKPQEGQFRPRGGVSAPVPVPTQPESTKTSPSPEKPDSTTGGPRD